MSFSAAYLPTNSADVGEQHISPSRLLINNTSAGVTNQVIPTARHMSHFKRAAVTFGSATVPAGTVACTMQVRKWKTDGSFVAVSEAVSFFGRAQYDEVLLRPLAGSTARDRTKAAGEVFVLTIDNSTGTITTQGVEVHAALLLAVMRTD